MQSIYIIPPALYLLTGFSLAILSIAKGRRNYENILFGLLCICFSLLSIAFISHFIFRGNVALIMKIERAIHVLYVFLPAVSMAFFYHILQHKNQAVLSLSFALSFLLSLTTFTDYYFYGLHEFSWGYIAQGGPAFTVMGSYSMAVVVYLTLLSVRKLRSTTDPVYRLKLKYLMVSICTMGILSLGNIPAINGINVYPIGNFSFIPMLFMAWGIFRHDIIRINQYTKRRIFGTITRTAIIAVLTITVGLGVIILKDYSLEHIMSRTFPYGLPPLLSFLVCVFLSLIGVQVGENRRESLVFSLAILFYALLSLDIYCNCIVTDQQLGLMISRINHVFLVFMPPLILHMVFLVTGRSAARWIMPLAYVLSFAFALTTQSDLYLSGSYNYYWGFFARVGPLFNAWSLISTAYLLYSLLLMWQYFRGATDRNMQRRYLFLLIGTMASGLLTLGNIPAMLGHEIYPAGNFIFIPVILLTMGIYTYNIAEFARLGGNILSYAVLLSGVIAAAIYLPGPMERVPAPLNYALAFSSILFFGYTWRIINRRIFSSRKRELNGVYEDLNYRLSKCRIVPEITGILCDSLFRTVLVETCTFLHRDPDRGFYCAERKATGIPQPCGCESSIVSLPPVPGNHPLLGLFFLRRRLLKQEEIEEWLLREDLTLESDDMIRNAAIAVPFFFEDRLLAISLLGSKRDGSLYSRDETDFLNRLSLGVGPYLENAGILQNLENLVSERTGALRDSELKYRHIIDNARDFIYKADWRGNFTFANDAFVRMLGYPHEEILRMNYLDVIWPDRRDDEFSFYRNQLKNRVPESFHQLPCIAKSGAMVWIEQSVRTIFGKDGRIVEFDCIARDITERKKAEDARRTLEESLRRSEELHRLILDNVGDSVFICDLDGKLAYCNRAVRNDTGYDLEELLGKSPLDFVHPEEYERELQLYLVQIRENIDLAHHEFRFRRKDGSYAWVSMTIRMAKDQDGKFRFYGVARNVTEQKEAEEAQRALEVALRRSEEKYRNLLDLQLIGYYEVDLKGSFTLCNTSMATFLGYTPEEMIGKSYREVMTRDSAARALEYFGKLFTGELTLAVVELDMLHLDGHIIHSESYVSLMRDEDGRPTGFSGMGIDISARKKAEEALRQSEELHRLVLDNVDDLVFTCGLDGKFIYGNMAARRITGYSPEDSLGKNFLHFIHPEDRERELNSYRKQLEDNVDTTHHEFRIVKKDGTVAWLSQTVRMAKYDDGRIEFFGIARDITEKKKAEDARRELEAQKSRFFANVSHEIRTPLTLILSPIESYLQGDFGGIDRDFFENIYRNGLRLLKLINNLLDFAKIESGRMALRIREIDPVDFMRNYLRTVSDTAGARRIALRFESSLDTIPGLYADADKLDKIVMNVLSNALKFTEPGGTVTVRVSGDAAFCHIEIEDTGCGIPEEMLGRIFERFSQAGAGEARGIGTGIGLALAKEFTALHGGTITVKSRHAKDHPSDHGTVFTVTLLLGRDHFAAMDNVGIAADDGLDGVVSGHRFTGMREMADLGMPAAVRESMVPAADRAVAEGARTILVVDDNPDMRSYFASLLGAGYALHFAADGAEGLATAKSTTPDLVITDVMMPVMSGFEMTAALKADDSLKNVPVIMITANDEMVNKIAGLEHGADDYLVKPFNSIELMTRIASLLKTHDYQKQIFKRNQEIAHELEIARLLQRRLLPGRELDVPGYRVHGTYIPMDAVGGDFYDYRVRERFIDLFIADVSGHGLPGAFLSTIAKMGLDFISHRASSNGVLYRLNDLIRRSTVLNNYVTAFFCSLDTENNVLKYCSAGHTPPLLYRRKKDEFIELTTKGKPLGWIEDPAYEEKELALGPGDRLVLYTDGITECANRGKELFGDERLMELIRANASLGPEQFAAMLIAALKAFSGAGTFDDDVTLVVFDVL
ncbi:MAG: PAS domain S-box protein [Spirochaetes bacterium]|nr:PAS domain S-box protein [Spirochaetota bacterium]